MKTNVAIRIQNKLRHIVKNLIHTMKYYGMNRNELLVVNAWMNLYDDEPENRNLGDELNYYLIKELSGKRLVNKFNLFVPKLTNICCIGSIVDSMADSQSIIWGSGAIADNRKMKCVPLEVRAVRGKLTRKYLLSQGIECPPVYGDPALLLPMIYKPNIVKKYAVGIIPHYVDMKSKYVVKLVSQMKGDAKIIHMANYKDWHDVIDEINQCQFILSSSLHGLIIADSYGIPNKWIEFSNKVTGNGFKFRDYFSSVGRIDNEPVQINGTTRLTDLLAYKSEWKPIDIDLNKLLCACPFKVQDKYCINE